VKLIAEPWDLGESGYQVGNFPVGWTEWNDKYRDTMRAYWKGDGGLIGEFARRLTGSSGLYGSNGRRPYASINFITAHDGFTLDDLVSYNGKHNEANLEDNRDGHDNNLSWNAGVEGPTDDAQIATLRGRQKRNMIATLLLSQGVPMLLAGDELGRTQGGNNNAYCQDTPISWIHWDQAAHQQRLFDFFQRVIRLRHEHPVLRRRHFFQGRTLRGTGAKDVAWLKPDGSEMTEQEWEQNFARCLGMYLAGEGLVETDERGRRIVDSDFLVLFNAHHEEIGFTLPQFAPDSRWLVVLDTAHDHGLSRSGVYEPQSIYPLQGRSLALLQRQRSST